MPISHHVKNIRFLSLGFEPRMVDSKSTVITTPLQKNEEHVRCDAHCEIEKQHDEFNGSRDNRVLSITQGYTEAFWSRKTDKCPYVTMQKILDFSRWDSNPGWLIQSQQ